MQSESSHSEYTRHEKVTENEEMYSHADAVLKGFAHRLLEYPPLANIPAEGYFRKYLQQVANVIINLFPFQHLDIGKAPIVQQIGNLLAVKNFPEKPKTLYSDHDCKIPAAITAYYLSALAEQQGWPLKVEPFVVRDRTHAFLAVKLPQNSTEAEMLPFSYAPDECYLMDYEYLESKDLKGNIPGVSPHGDAEYEYLVEKKFITRETDLEKGLMLYDGKYYDAGGE